MSQQNNGDDVQIEQNGDPTERTILTATKSSASIGHKRPAEYDSDTLAKKAHMDYANDEEPLSKGEFYQCMLTLREETRGEINNLQKQIDVHDYKFKKLDRNVEQLEFENRKLLLRVEGIPNECTDIAECLTEIISKGAQVDDFKIEELQQYKFLPGMNKAGKKSALMGFESEERKKLVLSNSSKLKDYRFKQSKIMISPFYTNRQQAIRNAQMATKKAVEIALEQHPDLLSGGKYLRPVGHEKLALPNEKSSIAKPYSYWKNKLIDLGNKAQSKPYASAAQEYQKAFDDIIAAEKRI